jgi:hypothetical protein
MGDRFVGRVRVPGRVRGGRRDRVGVDGVARGVAVKPDVSTQLIQPPDLTSAIFVDRSGRRARRLRRVVYALVMLALLLLGLLWLSQGADVFGFPGLG